jgi:hypothetical protein
VTTGYSGTPLAKKLGLTSPVFGWNVPKTVTAVIAQASDVNWVQSIDGAHDAHLFVTLRSEMEALLKHGRTELPDDATIWISWPKKASKVPTDITEDTIREVCLPMGWVDVKVCAVDDVWSGLKLVVRKELRNKTTAQAA